MQNGMDPQPVSTISNHPLTLVSPPRAHDRAVPLDRTQILDATDRCLVEHGYDGTTIRRIAATLDCAVGSIYRYFEDKRQLLEAVTQRRFDDVARLADEATPIEQTVLAYAKQAAADQQAYRLMFWLASLRPGMTHPADALPGVVRRIMAAWSRQLGDEDRAQRLWSYVHGAVMLGRDAERAMREAEPMLARKGTGVTSGGPTIHVTVDRVPAPLAATGS